VPVGVVRHEEVTSEQDKLVLYCKGLSIVSTGTLLPSIRLACPEGHHLEANVLKLLFFKLDDGPSVVTCLNIVCCDEVVVVSVLVDLKLELGMEGIYGPKWFLLLIFIGELRSLVYSVDGEVESIKKCYSFVYVLAVWVQLTAAMDFNREGLPEGNVRVLALNFV
jgi:hypothetical protein